MKKNLIIYHQIKEGVDCPDGIAAAWCADRYFRAIGRAFDIVGCSYQSEIPDVSGYDDIYVLDFSFPRSIIEDWLSKGLRVFVLDHHKTALENIGDVSTFSKHFEFNFDLNQSGATLAWKYFNVVEDPPAFLEYVRDRDLWNHLLPMTEEIHEASANLRYEIKKTAEKIGLPVRDLIFTAFDHLATLSQDELVKLMGDRGFELLTPKREAIQKAFDRVEFTTLPYNDDVPVIILDKIIPVVRLDSDGSEDRLVSDICSKLYAQFTNSPFVACITSSGDWSLRSDKHGSDFDVSEIAKLYGGGGHRNAAGFKVNA